ncbi:MAG: VanZ family protein, partial [Firmicutes bacterium]|nr:VanZ family protein [Bacillota bacterium]
NLIPFSREMDISYPGNLLLFIPFGWLVPLIWKKWDRLPRVAGAALALSFLIEASQLLNNRFSDVDDLIINTAGALLGYLLFRLTARPADRPRPETSGWELPLYTAVMLAGHFFLFHELAAAALLYGF